MTTLVAPDVRYHRSLLRAAEALEAEGNGSYLMLEQWPVARLRDPDEFRRYVDECRSTHLVRPEDAHWRVPSTWLWILDDEEQVVGRVSIRHRLTENLVNVGGHIGYAVIPSARRRGHATAALEQSLDVAARLGIHPALVTCDDTNIGSRRTIENNGGVLEDVRDGKLRFWVPTDRVTRPRSGSPAGRPAGGCGQ